MRFIRPLKLRYYDLHGSCSQRWPWLLRLYMVRRFRALYPSLICRCARTITRRAHSMYYLKATGGKLMFSIVFTDVHVKLYGGTVSLSILLALQQSTAGSMAGSQFLRILLPYTFDSATLPLSLWAYTVSRLLRLMELPCLQRVMLSC